MSRYGLLSDLKKLFTSSAVNLYALLRYKLGSENSGLNTDEKRERRIIVSLTTIPTRLKAVQISLDCMLRQTVKPDKIIVNLGQELFVGRSLPKAFRKLEKRGVEFRFVPYLSPHTKYYYTMKEYPDDIIITIDDDVIYRRTVVEELMKSYQKHPYAVSCLRAHRIIFDQQENILPYNQWEYETTCEDTPSMFMFSTGAGGVLYPPNVLYHDLFNEKLFTELCYRQDDIWLKVMELLNHTPMVLASKEYRRLTLVQMSQKVALKKTNIHKGENDICIDRLFKHYSITYSNFINIKKEA